MKNYKVLMEKAYIYATYGVAVSIPLYENISTISIIVWLLLGLFHLESPKKILIDRSLWHQLILPFYFLLTIIALFYTKNVQSGWAHIERQISLFLIPLMIILTSKLLKPHLSNVLRAFVFSVIVISILCLVVAFFQSLSFGEDGIIFNAAVVRKDKSFFESNNFGGNYFFHKHLSLFKHPSYFAIFICFSLFWILRNLFKYRTSKRRIILTVALVIYLMVFLFLLSSRISYIYLVLTFVLGMIIYFKRLSTRVRLAMVLSLFAFVVATLMLNYRMVNVFRQDISNTPLTELMQRSNSMKRIVVWRLVIQYENKIRIAGTGPGDVYDTLYDYYDRADLTDELEGINTHNQFLQSYMGLGVIGLITILLLFVPLCYFKSGYLSDHFQLLLLTFVFFMVETALQRNAYIVFFSFFQPITFYLYHTYITRSKKECKKD